MKVTTVIALGTFVGTATICVVLGAAYPIAIWAVGFGAISHKTRNAHAECPLLQAAAARAREDG